MADRGESMKVWCCQCAETKMRQDLELKYNPYFFKNKAYCKQCGKGALISAEREKVNV